MMVTSEFFDILGVPPLIGRGFIPEEGSPGALRARCLELFLLGSGILAATRAPWSEARRGIVCLVL